MIAPVAETDETDGVPNTSETPAAASSTSPKET